MGRVGKGEVCSCERFVTCAAMVREPWAGTFSCRWAYGFREVVGYVICGKPPGVNMFALFIRSDGSWDLWEANRGKHVYAFYQKW